MYKKMSSDDKAELRGLVYQTSFMRCVRAEFQAACQQETESALSSITEMAVIV
jgi:hypothetical protein